MAAGQDLAEASNQMPVRSERSARKVPFQLADKLIEALN
jgi:hypothetical protein